MSGLPVDDLRHSRPGEMTAGSLCTGYGGLDLATSAVLGAPTVWAADDCPHASKVIATRLGVPNLGDITAVDWSEVEPVDVVTAGFPCQDLSYAGRGAGLEGDRSGLWFDVLAAVRVLRPRWVVVENVAALLGRGLDVVTHGLASSGYVGAWTCVRASDVGACHRRYRVFILAADAQDFGHERPGGARGWGAGSADGGDASSDPDGWRFEVFGEHDRWSGGPGFDAPRWYDLDRLDEASVGGGWGEYEPAIRRHEFVLGRPAPAPVDNRGRLSPRFVEWMMMLPDGWVTDVLTSRTKALKCLGNGVVPPQAAYAITHLLDRLRAREVAA